MKATVIKAFADIETLEPYGEGDTYDGRAERVEHLVSNGYLKPLESDAKPRTRKAAKTKE